MLKKVIIQKDEFKKKLETVRYWHKNGFSTAASITLNTCICLHLNGYDWIPEENKANLVSLYNWTNYYLG